MKKRKEFFKKKKHEVNKLFQSCQELLEMKRLLSDTSSSRVGLAPKDTAQ